VIDLSVSGAAIRGLSRVEMTRFLEASLRAVSKFDAAAKNVGSVSVAFVDDREMRRLNRSFRKRDKTTDVLTFPADASYDEPGNLTHMLGDIVICIDQARRQAKGERHSLATEVRYLLLHGVIHALGYDHETDDGEMNALELKARKRIGLE
jgi:probable rRNA maturation factor